MDRQHRSRASFSKLGKRFESIREAAEGILVRTQEAMGRSEQHPANRTYERTDIGQTLEKTSAKKVSVVIYLLSVTVLAVIAAFYYALAWKPPTERIFNWTQPAEDG